MHFFRTLLTWLSQPISHFVYNFSIHFSALHMIQIPTLPPFITRWHTIRCFLKNPTCWLVGTQYKNPGRLPWTSIVSGQLDKCQPQSWHYQATDSERTRRRIHRRDPWYQNSWRTLAQRHCLREVGSCSCRQSGSKIGRHIPERQRLPNLRHISFFLSFCLLLQEECQGASIDIKAAHKRMFPRRWERFTLIQV